MAFARHAGVGQLVGFHHDPWHDDDTLDMLYSGFDDHELRVSPAREGVVLETRRPSES